MSSHFPPVLPPVLPLTLRWYIPWILLIAAFAVIRGFWNLNALPQVEPSFAVALVLFLLSVVVTFHWARRFRKANPGSDPHQPHTATALITTGTNALSRNPLWLGMLVMLLAMSAISPVLGLPLTVAIWVYLDRHHIPAEERVLSARFGAEYDAYRARVRRWL